MKFFERETKQAKNSSEIKLNSIIKLVKDLSRPDFNRLHEGMELIYNGYQKIKNTKTNNEKELDDIDSLEKTIEEIK
jgi:hypothetical protein